MVTQSRLITVTWTGSGKRDQHGNMRSGDSRSGKPVVHERPEPKPKGLAASGRKVGCRVDGIKTIDAQWK